MARKILTFAHDASQRAVKCTGAALVRVPDVPGLRAALYCGPGAIRTAFVAFRTEEVASIRFDVALSIGVTGVTCPPMDFLRII